MTKARDNKVSNAATEKTRLITEYQVARQVADTNPSPESRQAAIDASARLSAWVMRNDPPKRAGYASRAGKRQYDARRR